MWRVGGGREEEEGKRGEREEEGTRGLNSGPMPTSQVASFCEERRRKERGRKEEEEGKRRKGERKLTFVSGSNSNTTKKREKAPPANRNRVPEMPIGELVRMGLAWLVMITPNQYPVFAIDTMKPGREGRGEE